jgi:hypothetical protein
MTQTKNTDRYDVTVSHPEWDHTICSYSSKKDALERASYVRTHGSFFCEDLSKSERGKCHVMCYDRLLKLLKQTNTNLRQTEQDFKPLINTLSRYRGITNGLEIEETELTN